MNICEDSTPRSARRIPLLLLFFLLAAVVPARAHNAEVHRAMTDRAYQIMVALSKGALENDGNPALIQLAADAGKAVSKLRVLPAGLPAPRQSLCIDPETIQKLGTNTPSWGAPSSFESMRLVAVPFPITLEYITGNDCGIDPGWTSGVFFDAVNAPATGRRDFTGEVLGFWAHQPDDEEDDWHLFAVRPSNAAGLSEIKQYIETAGGAAVGTVWVTLRCTVTCLGDFLGLGGDCKDCLDKAIQDAKTAVHEGVSTVDGLLPGFGDIHDRAILSGMGHHLNVVPGAQADFDDRPGLLFDQAGPNGQPDPVELVATAVTDAIGTTVRYDKSHGPKDYEISDGQDFHPDSRHREAKDWEFLSLPHTPFTPVDNLAFSGWKKFRDNPQANVRALGWPLHAFGDATVPMHVAATFGWGHRPYEDAVANLLDVYLFTNDRQGEMAQAGRIFRRALVWRQTIQSWRAAHPGREKDIPVRDLVTQLANSTWDRVKGPGMLAWPFDPFLSATYYGPLHDASISFYETAAGSEAVNRELLEEGIAVELAFLVSTAEVLP
jgi:hypothetical protein